MVKIQPHRTEQRHPMTTTDSRDTVLGRIRAALGTAAVSTPVPREYH
jgi:hypothetical protein